MGAVNHAVERWRKASEAGDIGAQDAAIREALALADDAPDAAKREAARVEVAGLMGEAAAQPDEAIDILRKLHPEHRAYFAAGPELFAAPRPISEWRGKPEPAPVLWRDAGGRCADESVLTIGEVALLSGAGGSGKSYLSLALAMAAAEATGDSGTALGLRVRAGPVVLVSYEDSPVRLATRLEKMGAGHAAYKKVHVLGEPAPLFIANPEGGVAIPGRDWRALWDAIRAIQPVLVVVDPASAALADVSTSEGGPVRAFMRALASEAEAALCGVLIVAHDTKGARNAARVGEEPGAGAVAGSATWFDAARGVLYLRAGVEDRADQRIVECIKANHGQTHWGLELAEDYTGAGAFRGFRLLASVLREDMPPQRKALHSKDSDGGGKSKTRNSEFAPGVA